MKISVYFFLEKQIVPASDFRPQWSACADLEDRFFSRQVLGWQALDAARETWGWFSDDNISAVRLTSNPKLDYGPTGWDRPNVFNLTYVYRLPSFHQNGAMKWLTGGWELSGITRFWSGTPFTAQCGGTSATNAGATIFCDSGSGSPYLRHGLQWLNGAAFAQPANGTIGTTTRNEFRGPGYSNWNISVFKNIEFTESIRLQLRLETFNTFNHIQFGGSNGGINNSLGGGFSNSASTFNPATAGNACYINGQRDPRQIQLGIKMYF